MSLYDMQIAPNVTDEMCACRLARQLTQAVGMARVALRRVSSQIGNSPGGKAALVTELGADAQEVVAILDKLTTLVNAHKAAGDATVTAPLVQGDLV